MTWMVVSCIFTAASSIFSSIHRMKVLWDRRFRSWKLQLVTLEARNAGSCSNFLSPNFTATTAVFNSDTGWRHPAERFALKKAGSKEHCEVMSLVVCGWWTTTCSVEATINWEEKFRCAACSAHGVGLCDCARWDGCGTDGTAWLTSTEAGFYNQRHRGNDQGAIAKPTCTAKAGNLLRTVPRIAIDELKLIGTAAQVKCHFIVEILQIGEIGEINHGDLIHVTHGFCSHVFFTTSVPAWLRFIGVAEGSQDWKLPARWTPAVLTSLTIPTRKVTGISSTTVETVVLGTSSANVFMVHGILFIQCQPIP